MSRSMVLSVMNCGSRIDRYLHCTDEGEFYTTDIKENGVLLPVCYDVEPTYEDAEHFLQLCLAKKIVNLYEEFNRKHEEAKALPYDNNDRTSALVVSSGLKAVAMNLAKVYCNAYMGGYDLSGRDMGESKADYHAASLQYRLDRINKALMECRNLVSQA